MKKYLFLILISAALLLAFKLTQVPPGINGDEVGIGYNAALISKNLTDENGNFLPLFVYARSSDWKQPVTIYATAFIFKLLGVSYFNLRFTSILFVLVSIVFFYFIAQELKIKNSFWFLVLAFVTTPIVVIQSHLALENIAPLPFILGWLLGYLKYKNTNKTNYLLFAGALLGAGIFSYLGMRLVVPVLVLFTLIFLRKNFKNVLVFLVGFSPFALLLIFSYFKYPGAVIGNFKSDQGFVVYDFLYRYFSLFDPTFLFFKGDSTTYHSTGKYGALLLALLPTFIFGAHKILKDKGANWSLILLSFFTAPLLFALVPEIYRASRILALLPFYILIAGYGFDALAKKIKFVVVVLVFVNFIPFINDYWFSYPKRVKVDFATPLEYAFVILKNKSSEKDISICVDKGLQEKEKFALIFFKEAYLPEKDLKLCDYSTEIPKNTLAILDQNSLTKESKMHLEEVSSQFGFYKIYLIK